MKMKSIRIVLSCAGALALAPSLHAKRVQLKTETTSCVIETEGARVLSFVAPDGREALWNADPAQLTDAKWAHGGIPLCWPWFGVNGKVDIHGTAWRRPFSVVSRQERRDRAELVLARDEGAIRLEYTLVLRDTLKLELKTTNAGSAPFAFSAGFHPYFRVGERDQTEVGGILPDRPLPMDVARDDVWPTKPGSCSIYRLHDKSLDRTTYLFFENATGVNVWNPGAAKDCPGTVPGDDWRRFVCVEPILGEAAKPVTLKPGESVTLMMGVDVRKGAKSSGFVGADPRRPKASDEPTGRPFHILYLGAHPDDADYAYAAQMVKLVRAGAKVTVVAFCNGCKGHVTMTPEALAARRLKEAQAAARIYGLERYIVLESPDCELEATRAWREKIGRLVRDVAPDMVLTHRLCDYHADHRAVGQIVQDVTYFLGVPHWCPDTPVPAYLPFFMYAVDTFTSPRRMRADIMMSAAGGLEEGARGMGCHESQIFEWMPPEMGDDPAALTDPKVRAKYVYDLLAGYYDGYGKPYADMIRKTYGRADERVAIAELSEYSRMPSEREIKILEAIDGFHWVGLRDLGILH